MSGIDLSKQEARLKDNKRKPLIVIGTAKKILEIIDKDPSLVRHTKTIVIDEVDKVLLPLHRKTPFKKLTHRENHPRPAKLLVEKILKISKVSRLQSLNLFNTVLHMQVLEIITRCNCSVNIVLIVLNIHQEGLIGFELNLT